MFEMYQCTGPGTCGRALAGRGGWSAGGVPDGQPVFNISDSNDDVKMDVKTEDGGAGSSTRGRHGGGRDGGR
jgi:hypothetical protein